VKLSQREGELATELLETDARNTNTENPLKYTNLTCLCICRLHRGYEMHDLKFIAERHCDALADDALMHLSKKMTYTIEVRSASSKRFVEDVK
jgi:hypothetical protein